MLLGTQCLVSRRDTVLLPQEDFPRTLVGTAECSEAQRTNTQKKEETVGSPRWGRVGVGGEQMNRTNV